MKIYLLASLIAALSFLATTQVHAANLITNPCFAGGSTSGWSLDAPYTATTTTSAGGCTWSVNQNQAAGSGYNNFYTAPVVTVTPNATYTLQFWYNMSSTNPTHLQINYPSAFGTNYLDVSVTSTGQTWVETQQTFNAGNATTVAVRFYNNNGAVNAYYDDFDLDLSSNFITNPVIKMIMRILAWGW